MEICLALAFFVIVVIVIYIQKHTGTTPSSHSSNPQVRITGRDDLTSWALHKHPQDIDVIDYRDRSVLNAAIVIHRDGGVNKVVKGPNEGRILTDREVDEYIRKN